MGYLLVISNDDYDEGDDDDDECELCVYPRPEGRSIWWHGGCTWWIYCGGQRQIQSELLNSKFNALQAREVEEQKKRALRRDLRGPETMKLPNGGQTLAN